MKNEIRRQLSGKPSSTRIRGELADGRTAAKALEAPFSTVANKRDALVARREAQGRARTSRIWKLAVSLGAVAAFGIFGAPRIAEKIAPTATGHTYTQEELAKLPHPKKFTFQPNQGIDAAIAEVDGDADIFSDGPNLAAVEEYIAAQAPGGIVRPNETVQVPVLPTESK